MVFLWYKYDVYFSTGRLLPNITLPYCFRLAKFFSLVQMKSRFSIHRLVFERSRKNYQKKELILIERWLL